MVSTAAKNVDFIFDFASPNAYFVHKLIPAIADRTGATFTYIPCLLGGIFRATGNQAPMISNANIKGKSAYEMLEIQRFIARHALNKFTMNPHFPVNTLMLMRGAIVADSDGQLMRYVDAIFHHMWENPKQMDDPEIAASALDESGFDGASLLEKTQDTAVKAQLISNTDAAVARGTFGVPTLFVGDDIYFGKERLGQIEDALRG